MSPGRTAGKGRDRPRTARDSLSGPRPHLQRMPDKEPLHGFRHWTGTLGFHGPVAKLRHRPLPPRNVSGAAGPGRLDHDDRIVAAWPRAGAVDAGHRGNGSEPAWF